MNKVGTILSINILKGIGIPKETVNMARLVEGCGIEGDIHAGDETRQVCLFRRISNFGEIEANGLCTSKFTENILIEESENVSYPIGTRVKINKAILEITKIGKECYGECPITNKPKCSILNSVIFAKVINGGDIRIGDKISTCN